MNAGYYNSHKTAACQPLGGQSSKCKGECSGRRPLDASVENESEARNVGTNVQHQIDV